MKPISLIVVLVLLASGAASATPVTIINFSFENNYDLHDGAGWDAAHPNAGYGTWQHSDPMINGATDGDTIMWGPGADNGISGPLYQITDRTIGAGDLFTLTFDASAQTVGGPSWIVTLFYMQAGLRVPMVTVTFSDPDTGRGNVERYSLDTLGNAIAIDMTYDSVAKAWTEDGPTDWVEGVPTVLMADAATLAAANGNLLGVQFESASAVNGVHVDNVSLDAIHAPEPATMGLLAIGATALLRRRRK